MEVYKIWGTLNLKGDATKKMKEFSTWTTKACEHLTRINSLLHGFTSNINDLSIRFTALGANSATGLGKINSELKTANRETSNLNRKMGILNKGSSGVGHHGGFVSKHGLVRSLAAGSVGGAVGLAVAGAGYFGYEAARSSWDQQTEFQITQAQLRSRGLSGSQINQLTWLSSNARMRGVSSNNMMNAYKDSIMALQAEGMGSLSYDQAKKLAPLLVMGAYSAKTQFGKSFNDSQMMDAIRFAEIRAGGDPKKLGGALEDVFKFTTLSAGSVMPTKLLQIQRRAANVIGGITREGLLMLEPAIQELSANTIGTGLRTGSQLFLSGIQMTNDKADMLTKLGLIHGVKYSKTGRVMGTKNLQADPYFANLLKKNPVDFEAAFYKRSMEKFHFKSDDDYQTFLSRTWGSTMGNVMWAFHKNQIKEQRLRGIIPGMPDILTNWKQNQNTNAGAAKDLGAAWDNLATSLGKLTSPALIAGMNKLSDWINDLDLGLTKFAKFYNKAATRPNNVGIEPNLEKVPQSVLDSLADKYKNNGNAQVNLHVDGRHLASAVIPGLNNMLNQAGTSSGPNSYNQSLTPTSNGFNAINGGPG